MTAATSVRRISARRRIGRYALHLAILLVLVIVLYPGAWLLLASFRSSEDILAGEGLGGTFTLDSYMSAFAGVGGVAFPTYLLNSTILAVGSVIGIIISSSLAAYAFARIEFRGRVVWFALMIGTLLLPFHVLIIPQYIMFQRVGLVDTYVPLLLGKFLATEAFFVFLMVQFLSLIHI